ncbi:hypothetical protein [Sphingopyxis sp. C-1]|uniref:hypothetical protein n=1 Tax=Sphingopyxis sp. C-1 TaxID=262667 RepID=UPI0006BF864F|nr:hypothetical protein [Sphingopyxis sp. C-1]GAO78689.1 hypothetical protein SC1_01998 [Sphingopyxis sp. C-1]
MTAPARFKQSDLQRAMKAAKCAGFDHPRVILRPNGEIEIICGNTEPANDREKIKLV